MEPEFITALELTQWAAVWDRWALRADAAAVDWESIAVDRTQSTTARLCAARAARTVRSNAAEYRAEAAVMRDGEVPEPYWHLYTTTPISSKEVQT